LGFGKIKGKPNKPLEKKPNWGPTPPPTKNLKKILCKKSVSGPNPASFGSPVFFTVPSVPLLRPWAFRRANFFRMVSPVWGRFFYLFETRFFGIFWKMKNLKKPTSGRI